MRGICQRTEHVGRAQDSGIDDQQLTELRLAATKANQALRHDLV